MTLLADRDWRIKYTPDDGNLVELLYEPALMTAVRYDRLTGYFSASALALAARGVEWLVINGGRMRMVVGCTLPEPEVRAIEKGEALRAAVERQLVAAPLSPIDHAMAEGLELLAWLVAEGRLEIKVAVPCDRQRLPIPADGLFHEKSGIIEDKTGERLAFNGSLNETEAGWTRNWESLNVFTSWRDPDRVAAEDANFARLWADKAGHVVVLDVPSAVAKDLLRFLPEGDMPARVERLKVEAEEEPTVEPKLEPDLPAPAVPDLRRAVWEFIARAPTLPEGGFRVGETTSAVTPWPHQRRAFHRLYDNWPPKLLIADEVGLGKTIQAGMLLRQAWLAGKARRILIMAPKNVCRQWQIELREKFNLHWPIYDGQKLTWYYWPGQDGGREQPITRAEWHKEPAVIVSSHLVRRADRLPELLEAAEPWDLVVLDEAHHARRRGAGSASESGPNALLKLMRGLKERTQGLVLLTATPMQVHPVEVFDLLSLLGLPSRWSQAAFQSFFEEIRQPSPNHEAFDRLAGMFRAVEDAYGPVSIEAVQKLGNVSRLKAKKLLSALRDKASIPRQQLETPERKLALVLMRQHTPINRLVSRHTRELLRRYYKAGKLTTRIADRQVEDRFIDLSAVEREVYEAVEDYIASTWNQAAQTERNAIGFVMTIYRRRLASSFYALRQTLAAHLTAIETGDGGNQLALEEALDELGSGDEPDPDEAALLEQQALALEERSDIERLLGMISKLPLDTKLGTLRRTLTALREQGYAQAMVFTQFTDTMDFLRRELTKEGGLRVMCFSGRGGEVPTNDGGWRAISRDDAKARFREGKADILLCTDAAAEGLNFQFCGALINYDVPWNPMRVEQRIGRIDRLGQRYETIRIINLHYADTVEADVYRALRDRIGLFENVVGPLQPILARLPRLISDRVLQGKTRPAAEREAAVAEIDVDREEMRETGFDIDAVIDDPELSESDVPPSALTMDDLEKVIGKPQLLPPGVEVHRLGEREYEFRQPGLRRSVRVTTDPAYYEQHADTVELWSAGSPTFPATTLSSPEADHKRTHSMSEILAGALGTGDGLRS